VELEAEHKLEPSPLMPLMELSPVAMFSLKVSLVTPNSVLSTVNGEAGDLMALAQPPVVVVFKLQPVLLPLLQPTMVRIALDQTTELKAVTHTIARLIVYTLTGPVTLLAPNLVWIQLPMFLALALVTEPSQFKELLVVLSAIPKP